MQVLDAVDADGAPVVDAEVPVVGLVVVGLGFIPVMTLYFTIPHGFLWTPQDFLGFRGSPAES